MLKRRTGKWLLFLLVTTGLAGTVSNNSLSFSERKQALNFTKDTYKELLASVQNLSGRQFSFTAKNSESSIRMLVCNLNAADEYLWSLLQDALKKPINPEKRTGIKLSDEELMQMAETPGFSAAQLLPAEQSKLNCSGLSQSLRRFKSMRTRLIRYLRTSTEDLRNRVVLTGAGLLDCYQLCLLTGAISNRTTKDIISLKSNPAFPEK